MRYFRFPVFLPGALESLEASALPCRAAVKLSWAKDTSSQNPLGNMMRLKLDGNISYTSNTPQ